MIPARHHLSQETRFDTKRHRLAFSCTIRNADRHLAAGDGTCSCGRCGQHITDGNGEHAGVTANCGGWPLVSANHVRLNNGSNVIVGSIQLATVAQSDADWPSMPKKPSTGAEAPAGRTGPRSGLNSCTDNSAIGEIKPIYIIPISPNARGRACCPRRIGRERTLPPAAVEAPSRARFVHGISGSAWPLRVEVDKWVQIGASGNAPSRQVRRVCLA